MGKLYDNLTKQLETEYKKDAEECLKIYRKLKETTGGVWSSQWRVLVDTVFERYPSDKKRFHPTTLGRIFLKGIEKETT